ncbi:TonB-dependent receptor domain-containing protein [Acinetobacter qingfengensis]|uniref:TonB-dependent receptor n=1 Tax=Acinetobacter qingfengensis TaxID=1262585 RepID=A0A1E7QZ47_9GAMM|nr:TonB-dependent receptor [Acinetobacter qingfengensis]OEY92286.1 TonB-dependent receptor [Acinetobacter qingfengensis]
MKHHSKSTFISRFNYLSFSIMLLSPTLGIAAESSSELQTLPALVVTASQTAHSQKDAPASISVITQEDLAKSPNYDLADILANSAGIHINTSSAYGRKEIKIRGLDSDYTLLLVNGRRINSRDALTSNYSNDFDLSAIPIAAIDRIEVVRGPMSSLYGADALGGVVNIILKKPSDKTEGEIGYSYEVPTEGDHGAVHKTSAYLSGSLIENKLLANLMIEGVNQKAWQSDQSIYKNTDASEKRKAFTALSNFSWLINNDQTLDLDVTYRSDDRKATWSNYGLSFPTNIQEMDRTSVGLSYTGNWFGVESRLRYYYENVELMDDSEIISTLYQKTGDIEQTNHTLDGQFSYHLGDNHLLTAGSEFRKTKLSHNQNLNSTTSLDQSALYLQDEWSLNRLKLTFGGRYDHYESFGGQFSPRIYAVFNVSDQFNLKGGIGKAFKAPSISQSDPDYAVLACRGLCSVIGNPDLEPETATSYEFGGVYDNEQIFASLMLFQNDIKNMIVSDSWRAGYRPTVMTYTNIHSAKIKGIEFDGRYTLNNAWGIKLNYTFSDSENKTTGQELDYSPRHTGNIALDWKANSALRFELAYQYTGSQMLYVPALSQSQKSGAYHTVNLSGNYQFTPDINLQAGIKNLTNTKRDDIARSIDHILMSRSIFAGFNFKF